MRVIQRIIQIVFWDFVEILLGTLFIAIVVLNYIDTFKAFVMVYMTIILIKLMKIERLMQ
jgi:hypothetical protein